MACAKRFHWVNASCQPPMLGIAPGQAGWAKDGAPNPGIENPGPMPPMPPNGWAGTPCMFAACRIISFQPAQYCRASDSKSPFQFA